MQDICTHEKLTVWKFCLWLSFIMPDNLLLQFCRVKHNIFQTQLVNWVAWFLAASHKIEHDCWYLREESHIITRKHQQAWEILLDSRFPRTKENFSNAWHWLVQRHSRVSLMQYSHLTAIDNNVRVSRGWSPGVYRWSDFWSLLCEKNTVCAGFCFKTYK